MVTSAHYENMPLQKYAGSLNKRTSSGLNCAIVMCLRKDYKPEFNLGQGAFAALAAVPVSTRAQPRVKGMWATSPAASQWTEGLPFRGQSFEWSGGDSPDQTQRVGLLRLELWGENCLRGPVYKVDPLKGTGESQASWWRRPMFRAGDVERCRQRVLWGERRKKINKAKSKTERESSEAKL